MKTCSIEGCQGRVFAKLFCEKHYKRFLKYGDPLKTLNHKYSIICSVEGCGKVVFAKGLCSMHHSRVRRHGSVEGRRKDK